MSATIPLIAGVLAVLASPSAVDQEQAFLGIFAETAVMKMAGMPAMPDVPDMPDIELPPGVKLPDGVNLPGIGGGAMMMGRPQRKLEVRLWSPGLAPDGSTATLGVPAGLKLGAKLNLELYRPKPEEGKGDLDMPGGTPPDFTIKRYWGSSPTVKDGQPEVIRWDGLNPEQKAAMREQARKAASTRSYFYKPEWTTGYWPTGKAPGAVAKAAEVIGHYALETSYTGNVEIDVPERVNFLAPIELGSPNLEQKPPLDQPIVFKWKAVPNILGYHMMIMGMQGKNTVIMWSSSEIKADPGYSFDYMQMAEVAERVKTTAMMGPDRVEVTVPAGIFKDCDMVFATMVGFGPGAALDKAQPLPRVQTKTTLQVMLGGKMMKMDMR